MLVRAGVGWRPGIVGEKRIPVTNSPEGLTLQEGAVISPSASEETRFRYHGFMEQHGVEAFVNVLILGAGGRPPFGVLEVDSRSPREFSKSDIEFLETYANLLAAAIERLRVVSELREVVKQKELLIHELNHRVKNTLATVQSIAAQTLRSASTMDEARHALEERLIGLGRAHDVLTRDKWDGADLLAIVAQAVAPYTLGRQRPLHVTGPDVRLTPRMTLALAMALHELATNAVKYGALSTPTGEIRITWTVEETTSPRRLCLRWQEAGGPPVQPPARRGFGTRLIERSLAQDLDGNVRIDFARDGIICIVNAPLPTAANRNQLLGATAERHQYAAGRPVPAPRADKERG
jgi:two-component sensor histidine kinase